MTYLHRLVQQISLLTLLCLGLVLTLLPVTPAHAVTAADWRPGRIIDDTIFFNKDAMSVQQIQQFLDAKVPVCDTNHNASFWLYGYWNAPPYTCIKDYQENGKSAARIIWDAAQAYTVNPQVLIVILQRETGLITDTWAAPWQYKRALGYKCYDTPLGANVDANQNGCFDSDENFIGQVNGAAAQLRDYVNNPDNYNFKAGVTRNILYSPNTSCGSGSVYIETQGTAALYNYTPYQPNATALSNVYGDQNDGCSAYGNRNFWVFFNDWFGYSIFVNPILRSWQSGKMYYQGLNGGLYYITNQSELQDIGYGWKINSYTNIDDSYVSGHLIGDLPALIRFGDSPDVYSYTAGGLHYLGYTTYQAYGAPAIGILPSYAKSYFWTGADASTILRNRNDGNVYKITSGYKRVIVGLDSYAYYGIDPNSFLDSGDTIVSAIPEGAPLAKPGLVIKDSANNSGIVQTDSSIISLSPRLYLTLSLPSFGVSSTAFAKYTRAPMSALDIFAKDSANNLYLLDKSQKINLTNTQLINSGYSLSDFVLTPDTLLNQLKTVITSSNNLLVRIDSNSTVYAVISKELFRFETLSDFIAYGNSMQDVDNISSATASVFASRDLLMIPNGMLIRASGSPSVYLLTQAGSKSYIPTADYFTQLGYNFSWVRNVNSQTVANLPTGGNLRSYAYDLDGSLWIIHGGRRYLVPPALTSQYNLPSSSDQVTTWSLAALPRSADATKFIRIDTSTNVYLVDNGQTHLLSPSSYKNNGGTNWSDVTSVTQDLFSRIPSGDPR